jgi:hypothetical protein
MGEIHTTIPAFKRIVKETGNKVFESRGVVASTVNGMFVIAPKLKSDRVFPHSFPLRAIGYSGISSHDWKGLMLNDFEEAMREFVMSLSEEEKQTLKAILEEIIQ